MKTATLLHCSDPRLGHSTDARGEDRLRVFASAIEKARELQADAIIVSGHLLHPGHPAPAALARAEEVLGRAADAEIGIWTTADSGRASWLEYLAERGLTQLLAAGEGPEIRAARKDLRLVGLGTPRTDAVLAARAAAIPDSPDWTVTLVNAALSADPERGVTAAALRDLTARSAYVALGGNASPVVIAPLARDPGPITRADVDVDDEPNVLRVNLRARPSVRAVASGDRPLVAVRLDPTRSADSAELTAAVARRLGKDAAPAGCLLRIELETRPAYDIDESALLAAAAAVAPAVCAVRVRDEDGPGPTREEAEQDVLRRLTVEKPPGFQELAVRVFDRMLAGDADLGARAAEDIRAFLDLQPGGGAEDDRATP